MKFIKRHIQVINQIIKESKLKFPNISENEWTLIIHIWHDDHFQIQYKHAGNPEIELLFNSEKKEVIVRKFFEERNSINMEQAENLDMESNL